MRFSLALLLGPVLLASCASGGASSPAATATSSAPGSALPFSKQWKLGPVEDMAVSPVAVYAVYSPASIQGAMAQVTDNRLARIDRVSGAMITAGPFPYARTVAVAGGVVWMGGSNQYPATPFPGSSTLIGVDATSLRVRIQLSFPGPAQPAIANVAGDSDSLWIAYGASVYRLWAADGRTLGSRPIGGMATSIALDPAGKRVYVGLDNVPAVSAATITAFDAPTLTPIVSATTGGGDLGGPHLAAGAQDVWVSYATGMLGQVEHRQASNLAQLPVVSATHTNSVRVFEIGGMVWISDDMAGQVMCLDPRTGAVRASWETQNGGIVAGDLSQVYFGDVNGVVGVLKLDARCR